MPTYDLFSESRSEGNRSHPNDDSAWGQLVRPRIFGAGPTLLYTTR